MNKIYSRFDEMIPKEHKFYNYLLRVLNKKIKRKKRAEGEDVDGRFHNVNSYLSAHNSMTFELKSEDVKHLSPVKVYAIDIAKTEHRVLQ
jgi:hypothetical protein